MATKENIDNIKNRFAQNMRLGIVGPESGGRYDAQNSEGTAAGKYQFTNFWLASAKNKSIQAFAKRSNGVFEVPKNMEDFKKDPILQDAYFDYYAKEVLFPQVEKAYRGPNPAELSFEEMGALYHFKGPNDSAGGTGATKQIRTGKLDAATKKGKDGAKYSNASSRGYLNSFKKTLEAAGAKALDKKELIEAGIDQTDTQAVYDEFMEMNRAIDAMTNLDTGQKEVLRDKLYKEVANSGNRDIINDKLKEEEEKNASKIDAIKNLQEVFNGSEIISKNNIHQNITTPWDQGDPEKLLKDFPELKKYLHLNEKEGKKRLVVNQTSWQGNRDNETINKFTNDINKIFEKTYGKDNVKAAINSRTEKMNADGNRRFYDPIIDFITKPGANILNKELGTLSDFDITGDTSSIVSPYAQIDPEKYPDPVKTIEDVPSDETDSKPKKSESKKTEEVVSTPKKDPVGNEGEEYYNRALGMFDTTEDDFAMGTSKMEMPVDLVMGGMLAAIGNRKAKEPIPLRDEEVSNAFNRFASELAEKSKLGLPVEVEAKMKADLAEVYQGGLENIINASGGNRALVLGNQGQLEVARNRGIVDIQMADYEAKERAFEQYGKAVMYKNEFDANRDIANHGIRYNEAKEKQLEGRSIAAQGMNQILEGIKYQKENGPGSANAMYKSLMMQKMFGFDPNMVDDGTGTQKGTKSFYDAQKQKDLDKYAQTQEDYKKFGILNPEQKALANKFIDSSNDPQKIRSFQNHLLENPDLDLSKISLENMDIASQREDWGLLSMDRAKAIDAPIKEPNTINLTPEQLNEPDGALEPFQKLNAFGLTEQDEELKKIYESKGLV